MKYWLLSLLFVLSCKEPDNHKIDASLYVQPDASTCFIYLKNYQEDLANESLEHQIQSFKTKDISNLTSFQILKTNWNADNCSISLDLPTDQVGKAGLIQFYKDQCMSIKITPELVAKLHQETVEGNQESSDLLKLANTCKVVMDFK